MENENSNDKWAAEFDGWVADTPEDRKQKQTHLTPILSLLKGRKRVVDLGCGDGVFLEMLQNQGFDCIGIDRNPEMLAYCHRQNLKAIDRDALDFIRTDGQGYDTFVLMDLVEHLTFDYNRDLFQAMPPNSLLLLKTPYTNALLGHQFYLQAPSHVMPYCPLVLRQLLDRTGFQILKTQQTDPFFDIERAPNFLSKFKMRLVRKLCYLAFGKRFNLLFGGGNFLVVAKKNPSHT